ncbi:MAG: SlyX family protein [Pseudomonadales bacterium]|nr:SlyX family protein [Pseudomonadales bacterium]
MEDRLANIETQLAHQEETIHQLNQVIYQQQKQIDALELGTKHLMGRIQSLSEGVPETPEENEVPPHY